MNRARSSASLATVVASYVVTLALFFVASFWPGARVWGLAVWGYFPLPARVLLLICGLAMAVFVIWYERRASDVGSMPHAEPAGGIRWLWYPVIPVAWGVLAYLLRTETHFLGDGYRQLASLAGDQPLIRAHHFGAMALNVGVKGLFGTGEAAALYAYRTISIAAGVLFAAATLFTARRLFNSVRALALFAGGMLTGGYALLFFGYVESYAFFCLAVALFTYAGLLITQGHLRRGWILPAFGLTVFFHLLGLVLLPAALYILVRESRLSRRFARLKLPVRGAIWIVIVVKAVLLFGYLYTTNYYFRFAFIPLFPGRLVLEGYTLFSTKHLADWANLLFCLSPALLLLTVIMAQAGRRTLLMEPAVRFLLFGVGGTLVATFILDPKLGMPRDWGLFAFAGLPIAALLYLVAANAPARSRVARIAAMLAIALGLLALLPRVVVQHTPGLAIAQMEDYAHLDVRRNRTGVYALSQYLLDEGHVTIYPRVRSFRDSVYVEDRLAEQAGEMVRQQRYDDVRGLAAHLIATNPRIYSGWLYLGKTYLVARRYDSALVALRIADGLYPERTAILNELGLAYYYLQQRDKAEHVWLESATIDPGQFPPHYSLARIYRERGDNEHYIEHLRLAAAHDDAPAQVSLELADYYLSRRDFEPAKAAIYRALALGADSTAVRALNNKYPGLIDWQD